MKLLRNFLHVKRVPDAGVTTSGIRLPENRSLEFTGPKLFDVLAVGPGEMDTSGTRVPVEPKPGERVICGSYTEGSIKLEDGTEILSESMVLLLIPNDNRYENEMETPP